MWLAGARPRLTNGSGRGHEGATEREDGYGGLVRVRVKDTATAWARSGVGVGGRGRGRGRGQG